MEAHNLMELLVIQLPMKPIYFWLIIAATWAILVGTMSLDTAFEGGVPHVPWVELVVFSAVGVLFLCLAAHPFLSGVSETRGKGLAKLLTGMMERSLTS